MGRDMEKLKRYQKEYYKKNRDKIREYQREYREKNIDKAREYGRKWAREHKEYKKQYYEENKEHIKEIRKRYYQEHKEEIYKQQQKYISNNREHVTKLVVENRKRKAEQFKAEGQMHCYLPKTERQNKMVQTLCRKRGLSEEESRKLLEERNWNIKGILNEKENN